MSEPPPFEMDLSLQVGKYDILKLLGKGATGMVYLATDTFSGKQVALKTIEPEVFRDPEFGTVYRSQFLNEASLAGKLKHPHIVMIYDAVVQDDSGHIAMEVVNGGDLSQFATPETLLPVADVLQIGFKCCGALEYAAREGIVHRDIKPANIMVAEGTDVKISDFGAAFLRKSQAVQTASMGSPFYMSPEQINNETLTFHSDMYSLGVVLYELLTGQRPFSTNNIDVLVEMIRGQDPAPPSQLRPGLPQTIDNVVLRAMQKQPGLRYDTWAEFAADLSSAVKLVLPPDAIADTDKYMALKKVPLLATLGDPEIWELVKAGRWSHVAAKLLVVLEKEPGQSLFFVAAGNVKVLRQGRLLNVIGQGEFFGEISYISVGDLPRQATVEAMTDLLLAEFEPAAIERMSVEAQLHLTRTLVRNMADRLITANSRLAK